MGAPTSLYDSFVGPRIDHLVSLTDEGGTTVFGTLCEVHLTESRKREETRSEEGTLETLVSHPFDGKGKGSSPSDSGPLLLTRRVPTCESFTVWTLDPGPTDRDSNTTQVFFKVPSHIYLNLCSKEGFG